MDTATRETTDVAVREVPVGTEVIFTDEAGTYTYDGECGDGTSFEVAGFFGHGPMKLRAKAVKVAPANVTVPTKDGRVGVTKQPKGTYPTWVGPWRATFNGKGIGFFKTKREGTAAGMRHAAITDWHAEEVLLVVYGDDVHLYPVDQETTARTVHEVGLVAYPACDGGFYRITVAKWEKVARPVLDENAQVHDHRTPDGPVEQAEESR